MGVQRTEARARGAIYRAQVETSSQPRRAAYLSLLLPLAPFPDRCCCLWHPPPHNAHTIQLTNLILLTNYTPPTYFSTTLRSRLPPPALAQPAAATSNCVARDVAVFPHRVENAAAELRDFEASVEPRPRRVERLRVAVLVR